MNWSSGALVATRIAADGSGAAAGAAGLLPERGDRARIAGEHGDVEVADVDAELERVGGHDAEHLARRAARCSIARRRVRQVAAAVAAHDPGVAGGAVGHAAA